MLRQELAPAHGRMAGSLRTAFAATFATLLLLILQAPVMAQGVFLIFLVSYETPYLTLKRSLGALALQCLGTGTALCLVAATDNDPMARVIAVAAIAFMTAFIRATAARFIQITDFAIFAIAVIYSFDTPAPVNLSLRMSMWPITSGAVAVGCKIAIEYIFTRRNPFYALFREVDARLLALENLFLLYASHPHEEQVQAAAAQVRRFAFMGQGRMQALLQEVDERHKKDISRDMDPAIIPVLARLLDLSAAFAIHNDPAEPVAEKARLHRLAQSIAAVREGRWDEAKLLLAPASQGAAGELDRIEHSLRTLLVLYTGEEATSENALPGEAPIPLQTTRWLVPDAFTNPEYTAFALKVSLCAILCYVIFNALAWPGISTAVTTVLVAGLSTSGATNQKLLFRFLGSAVGGLICGLGCIVFVFPYIDTVTPFLIALGAVSFLAAWVARSPHFGYIGLQIAFSFYFVVLNGLSAPTQMTPARDRLAGILLALIVMLIVFRPEKSVDKMRQAFAHLLSLQADYLEATASHVPAPARRLKAIELRNKMEHLVSTARGFAEMMMYEFSRDRESHLETSEKIESAISSSGDLLLSISSWPRESSSDAIDGCAQQSRTMLENGLRFLAAALERNSGSGGKPEGNREELSGQVPVAVPIYINNSLEIFSELQQQCGAIALL
jgi:multidrug resistance protein MdtO